MTSRSASLVALLVTVTAASVATRQLPPGYVDPAPVLDAAAKAIGTANLRCVTISGTAYAGAVGQQTRVGAQRRLAENRRVGELHADDGLGARDHEGGVRSQARIEPRVVEVRCPLARRPAPAERHQVFTVKDNYAWHMDGPAAAAGGVDAGPRGNLTSSTCG